MTMPRVLTTPLLMLALAAAAAAGGSHLQRSRTGSPKRGSPREEIVGAASARLLHILPGDISQTTEAPPRRRQLANQRSLPTETSGDDSRKPAEPSGGDPPVSAESAQLYIRRRRVLQLPRRVREDSTNRTIHAARHSQAATGKTFKDFLAPPFLELLNDSYFSLQPEFLLAQGVVGDHQMQPFRDFGMKLGNSDGPGGNSTNESSRERSSPVPLLIPENSNSSAGKSDSDGDRQKSVIQRVIKIRGTTKTPTTSTTVRPEVESVSSERQRPAVPEPLSAATSRRENGSDPGATEETVAPSAPTPTTPVSSTSTARPSTSLTPDGKGKIATSLKPSQSSTATPTTEAPAATTARATTTTTTLSPGGERHQGPTSITPPVGRKGVLQVESGDDEVESEPVSDQAAEHSETITTISKPYTKGNQARALRLREQRDRGSENPPPRLPRRPTSELLRSRLSRYRSRRLGQSSSTTNATTTPSPPLNINKEKKEVSRVLGLLGRIRNRARTVPSFINFKTSTTENPSTTVASTTTSPKTTTSSTEPTTPKTTTTLAATQTPKTTTTSPVPPKTSTTPQPKPAAESLSTRLSRINQDAPPSSFASKVSGADPQDITKEEDSSHSKEEGTLASSVTPGKIPAEESALNASQPTTEASYTSNDDSVLRRYRKLNALRRPIVVAGTEKPNLLARRLEERRHLISKSGVQATDTTEEVENKAVSPQPFPFSLLPIMTPFPIILTTLKSTTRPNFVSKVPTSFRINLTYTSTTPSSRVEPVAILDAGDVAKSSAPPEDGNPIHVLGTSSKTSVSVDVSPLEYKLRKRLVVRPETPSRTTSATTTSSPLASSGATVSPADPERKDDVRIFVDSPIVATDRPKPIPPQDTSTSHEYLATPEGDFDSFTAQSPSGSSLGPGGYVYYVVTESPEQEILPVATTTTIKPSSRLTDIPETEDPTTVSTTIILTPVTTPAAPVHGGHTVRVPAMEEVLLLEEEDGEREAPVYLVSLLFVLPVIAVSLWYLKKYHLDVQHLMPKRLRTVLAPDPLCDIPEDNCAEIVDKTSSKQFATLAQDTLARRRKWEYPREKLRLDCILGEGHFGQVWKAEADSILEEDGVLTVAVKNVKENASPRDKQDLLRELRIMQDLGYHPNVVRLLGCCTDTDPVLVIMEYVVFGKLLTYLRENRGRHNYYNFSHDAAVLTSRDLTLFACQIAAGMEYIANKGIIHRDLAARNILVDRAKICKVSDFGMSRSARAIGTETFEQKHRGALPIRWMSPESLYSNAFNQKTDCWSFGILLWEIITLGSTPYPGLSAREVMRSVREGYRLERPDHCHPQLYQLAASCWTAEPDWRPSFTQLRAELEALLEDQTQGYVDLDRFQEEIYGTLNKSSDEKV